MGLISPRLLCRCSRCSRPGSRNVGTHPIELSTKVFESELTGIPSNRSIHIANLGVELYDIVVNIPRGFVDDLMGEAFAAVRGGIRYRQGEIEADRFAQLYLFDGLADAVGSQ